MLSTRFLLIGTFLLSLTATAQATYNSDDEFEDRPSYPSGQNNNNADDVVEKTFPPIEQKAMDLQVSLKPVIVDLRTVLDRLHNLICVDPKTEQDKADNNHYEEEKEKAEHLISVLESLPTLVKNTLYLSVSDEFTNVLKECEAANVTADSVQRDMTRIEAIYETYGRKLFETYQSLQNSRDVLKPYIKQLSELCEILLEKLEPSYKQYMEASSSLVIAAVLTQDDVLEQANANVQLFLKDRTDLSSTPLAEKVASLYSSKKENPLLETTLVYQMDFLWELLSKQGKSELAAFYEPLKWQELIELRQEMIQIITAIGSTIFLNADGITLEEACSKAVIPFVLKMAEGFGIKSQREDLTTAYRLFKILTQNLTENGLKRIV